MNQVRRSGVVAARTSRWDSIAVLAVLALSLTGCDELVRALPDEVKSKLVEKLKDSDPASSSTTSKSSPRVKREPASPGISPGSGKIMVERKSCHENWDAKKSWCGTQPRAKSFDYRLSPGGESLTLDGWEPSRYQKQGSNYKGSERWTRESSLENVELFGLGCLSPSGKITSTLTPTSRNSGRIVETIEIPCQVLFEGSKTFEISIRWDYYLQ